MLEFSIVLLLIALNGFFALSEMALMTSRKLRLKQMAEDPESPAARRPQGTGAGRRIPTTCCPPCRSASP